MASAEQKPTPPTVGEPVAVHTVLPLTWAIWFWTQARKLVILSVGLTVLLLGIAMLVLPGPGWLTIFAGLAVLATEFAWAGWILKTAKTRLNLLLAAARQQFGLPPESSDSATE